MSADELRLEGTGCTYGGPGVALSAACAAVRYVLLRMGGNAKYLAPREQGIVYTAVRSRLVDEEGVPLARLAWRVVPTRQEGWVQLQHVLSGRWMRLVAPPHELSWVVRAEHAAEPHGKETWFRLEGEGAGSTADLARAGLQPGRLRSHVQDAYLNYRSDDFVRGHGNAPGRGGKWLGAGRLQSTAMDLKALGVAELAADGQRWSSRRVACFASVVDPVGSAQRIRAGGDGFSEVCWKHFAEPVCSLMYRTHAELMRLPQPADGVHGRGRGDGLLRRGAARFGSKRAGGKRSGRGIRRLANSSTPSAEPAQAGAQAAHLLRMQWARLDCDKYVELPPPAAAAGVPPRVALSTGDAPHSADAFLSRRGAKRRGGTEPIQCSPLTAGVLVLLVSDRANQFLCHYFESALLHGIRPTVLGWDGDSWFDTPRKPWFYYLGGKLVLPLEYLTRCEYHDDALLLFTDHDAVFQGGYAELRAAYSRAEALGGGSPLVFSAEAESYPLELKSYYPRGRASGSPAQFMNSGMWMGTVGAAKDLLRTMTGVSAGESMARLLRHYRMWGALEPKRDPMPRAFEQNDQDKYAGLYVSQELAAACSAKTARSGRCAGGRVFLHDGRRVTTSVTTSVTTPVTTSAGGRVFLHDGRRRCAGSCDAAAKSHVLKSRLELDRRRTLFENMYHAGAHTVTREGYIKPRGKKGRPIVLHYNGPAKVVFEAGWGLPWDTTAGKTPVLHQIEGMRRAAGGPALRAAVDAFDANVTFTDRWLRRARDVGPLRFVCDVPLTNQSVGTALRGGRGLVRSVGRLVRSVAGG